MTRQTEMGLVVSSVTYFLVIGLLLASAGFGGSELTTLNPDSGEATERQGLISAVGECVVGIVTFGLLTGGIDCDRDTRSELFETLEGIALFAARYIGFFFQLLTFQLPIPAILNAIIVIPPSIGLAYVGLRLARGGG